MSAPLAHRLRLLRAFDRLMTERRDDIVAALARDFRKAPFETLFTEIYTVREEIRSVCAVAPSFLRSRRAGVPLVLWPAGARVVREPRGRVLVFSPWNYPFQLALSPLVGAVAAGNTVVLKPSELTPATSRLIEELCREAFPEDLVRVVQGGSDVAGRLLREPWGLVFFTGSPAVGKLVARAAAETLSPAVLELGGKSPAVVLEGADIALAAKRVVWGKVANAGQTCIAPDYALVPRAEADRFIEACGDALRAFFPDGAANSPDYPALIHDRAFARMTSFLDGADIAWGGGRDAARRFVEPTVLRGSWDDPIMREEIFGPLLPVLTHDGPDDARAQIARAPDPLAVYAFGPKREAERFVLSVPAGGGAVNDVLTHFLPMALPFGGRGTSGIGSYHGRWSLETFTRPRGTLSQSTLDFPVRYPPYTSFQQKIVKFLTR